MSDEVNQARSDLLRHAGIAPETVDAVIAIDGLMQRWRRRAMKRELGQTALTELKVKLDLTQLDVLFAIARPSDGETGETMVATVAERLNIDPSRASRLVSDMVELGYARRAVSQADARRTIIELSKTGQATVEAVRTYKLIVMGDFLGDWDSTELAAFLPLLKRFGSWMDSIEAASEKHAGEIAALAKQLHAAENPDT